jgi:mannitol/fructose-specific phosphotransferase system IIA component (Ntr-type)
MIDADRAALDFTISMGNNYTLVPYGATIPNLRHEAINHTELVIVRVKHGIPLNHDGDDRTEKVPVYAFFYLVSPMDKTGQHLRIMAQLANHIEVENFSDDWRKAYSEQELKEILLHSERLLTLWARAGSRTERFIGTYIRDLDLPRGTLVALVRREEKVIIPHGDTQIADGDRITIIGETNDIQWLYEEYVGEHHDGSIARLKGSVDTPTGD